MCGSVVKLPGSGVITELKNASVSALSTPSAAPVSLLYVRMRPLIIAMYWVGPTAPCVSGG